MFSVDESMNNHLNKAISMYIRFFGVHAGRTYLGGVYVVLQCVNEQVPHGLPGVPDPLRLLQGHVQLLHGGLGLQQPLQRPFHVPEATQRGVKGQSELTTNQLIDDDLVCCAVRLIHKEREFVRVRVCVCGCMCVCVYVCLCVCVCVCVLFLLSTI